MKLSGWLIFLIFLMLVILVNSLPIVPVFYGSVNFVTLTQVSKMTDLEFLQLGALSLLIRW
jgi:hypothetical protein